MKKQEVIERATEFCNEHGISEYPVRIVDLCEKLGFMSASSGESNSIIHFANEFNVSYDAAKIRLEHWRRYGE